MDSWYSLLGVRPDATAEQITAAVERLTRQANALSVTAPDRARQIRDQARAIRQDLLAGAERRQWYDRQLAARAAPPPRKGMQQGQKIMSRFTRFLQAGWTCAVCGYGALPADKFCPKCGNKIQPEPGTGAPQP
jgi:rubrerythrin